MFRFQSINHIARKIKRIGSFEHSARFFWIAVVILTLANAYFSLELYSIRSGRAPVAIINVEQGPVLKTIDEATVVGDTSFQGLYVGSKNGTKYHLPTCPGAKSIREANKVWFASKAEAEAAGYTPAGNCEGI